MPLQTANAKLKSIVEKEVIGRDKTPKSSFQVDMNVGYKRQ